MAQAKPVIRVTRDSYGDPISAEVILQESRLPTVIVEEVSLNQEEQIAVSEVLTKLLEIVKRKEQSSM